MTRIATLALCAVLSTCAAPAYALDCVPRRVADEYHSSNGLTAATSALSDGAHIVTYANPLTGAFLIVAELPTGLTCLLVSGSDFEQLHWGFDT